MNKTAKIFIVVALVVAVGTVIAIKQQGKNNGPTPVAAADPATPVADPATPAADSKAPAAALPRLVDLGAGKCIPCKAMKPILDELKEDYKQQFQTVFIDVWENPDEAEKYGIKMIPTQIFYDAAGQERFRHEGFYSKEDILAKWKEVGVNLTNAAVSLPTFERLEPAQADSRPKDQICYLCEGGINPKTLVTVQTDKGDVRLCGPHCYFIMISCLTEDTTDFESKVTVTDSVSGNPLPLAEAVFLSAMDQTGRPVVHAFAGKPAAEEARLAAGGNIISFDTLALNEMSHRCGFCDRACYPQDAAEVIVEGGLRTWGCCSHCALGVAARTGKDIEVHEKDRLTGEPIVVKTLSGSIVSLEPSTAVAWFGQRQKPDGTWASAGCFHQGFFTSADNLKQWVEQNPCETGRLISIHQALADKMKLSPEQIQKACKIGECSPR